MKVTSETHVNILLNEAEKEQLEAVLSEYVKMKTDKGYHTDWNSVMIFANRLVQTLDGTCDHSEED